MKELTSKKQRSKRSEIWFIPKDKLQQLLDNSSSFKEVLVAIGSSNKGGNHKTLKERIEKDRLDCTYLNANRLKERKSVGKRQFSSLEENLVINSNCNRSHLKKRLLQEGLLLNQCYECGQLPEWNGKPLTLQIDHINGVFNDNRLENLRILCPHCHSQTDSFAGRNQTKPRIDATPMNDCPVCGEPKEEKRDTCSQKCAAFLKRKIERPSKEELAKLLWEQPTMHLAKLYGVSGKAIEKWAKSYGLSKPPRGYWTKLAAGKK